MRTRDIEKLLVSGPKNLWEIANVLAIPEWKVSGDLSYLVKTGRAVRLVRGKLGRARSPSVYALGPKSQVKV